MRRSSPARHPIQNKFAHLHGRIVEQKERTKRAFTHASALNFVGSISPVRVPEFEADLNKLSRLSSPIGMDEIAKKYENIEELSRANVAGSTVESAMSKMNTAMSTMNTVNTTHTYHANYSNFNPYDHDLIPDDYEIPPEVSATPQPKSPRKNSNAISNENDQQTNFPTVISPMKRPQKDIEAEGNAKRKIYIYLMCIYEYSYVLFIVSDSLYIPSLYTLNISPHFFAQFSRLHAAEEISPTPRRR